MNVGASANAGGAGGGGGRGDRKSRGSLSAAKIKNQQITGHVDLVVSKVVYSYVRS